MTTYAKHLNETTVRHYNIGLLGRWNNMIENLKFSHFGLICISILFGSCMGGVAAMFILQAGMPIWVVGIALAASLANLVASIAQAPTKWVVNLFAISLLINIALLLIALAS
jgi:hypothetical protein